MVFTIKSDLCDNENFKRYAMQWTVPQVSVHCQFYPMNNAYIVR